MDYSQLGLGEDVVMASSEAKVLPEFKNGGTYTARWISCKQEEYNGKEILTACLAFDSEVGQPFINIRTTLENTPDGIKMDEYGARRFMALYKAFGIPFEEGNVPIVKFKGLADLPNVSIIKEINHNLKIKITSKQSTTNDKTYYNVDGYVMDEVEGSPATGIETEGDDMPDMG